MYKNYILTVNDDKDFTDLIGDYLEKEGFTTVMVDNGDIAFKHIDPRKPDLILLDLQTRVGDGKEIRNGEKLYLGNK